MLQEKIQSVSVVFYGVLLIFLGSVLLIQMQWIFDIFFRINLVLLFVLSLSRVVIGFLDKDKVKRSSGILYGMYIFILFLLVLNFPVFFGAMIPFIYGLWALLNGVAKFITWYNFHLDHIGHRVWAFFDATITLMFALVLIIDPLPGVLRLTYVAGAYLIFYGLLQLYAGLNLLLNNAIKNRLQIHIHFPLPMFVAMLVPSRVYKNLHKPALRNIEFRDQVEGKQARDELEIFFHLKAHRTDSFGHVDISFRDFIFSYGLHDPKSRYINGTFGDGVLIQVDRKKFIEYSIRSENKTIIAFTLKLNPQQILLIEQRMILMLERTLPWHPIGEIDPIDNNYASRVQRNTGAKFYKFTAGMFKTYFFVSTNCVLLVDYFVHFKELGLIRLNGLITPGSYFNFLNEAYQRSSPMVLRRIVYEKLKNDVNNG